MLGELLNARIRGETRRCLSSSYPILITELMTQPDKSALKARNRLLTMFLLLCVLDAALVIIAQDKWAIGRILLTIVVMYFVIQGRKWAKWLLIGICSLLVVILITMVFALRSKLSTALIVGSVIMSVLSAIIPFYMVSSKDLNRYFSYKRQAYSQ
jgi:O-antigen ligase